MSNAQARGWGRGWPTDRTADMVWVRAPISGARWQVHRQVAPILSYVVAEAERRGHLFDYGPGDVDDDWGYSNRPIAGTRTPSNHSWGLAVDIDAQNYPQGQTRRQPPGWLISLFKQWGFSWGGSYRDPMHFEFLGTPNDAAALVGMLVASGDKPVPVPPGTPSPTNPTPPNRLDGGGDDMVLRNSDDGAIWAVSATHMHHLTPTEWKQRSEVEKVTPFPVPPLYLYSLALAGRQVV